MNLNPVAVWLIIILTLGLALSSLIPSSTSPPPLPPPQSPNNVDPAWSPDGRYIAFSSDRDGNWEVYLLDSTTLEATRVTDNDAVDWDLTWGPGGDIIAFVSNRDAKSLNGYDIYTIGPLSKNVTRLTFRSSGWDGNPSWTAASANATNTANNAAFIVFSSDRDGNTEIYRLALADESVTRLTFRERNSDVAPTLSPDGNNIAFQSKIEGNWEIFVMDADGKNVKRLTFNPADDQQPAWSPDGKKIAFTSNRDGNEEIYVMDIDGRNKRNLTANPADDLNPTWSPNSEMIAFQSDRTGSFEIWRMNSNDGTDQKQLSGIK